MNIWIVLLFATIAYGLLPDIPPIKIYKGFVNRIEAPKVVRKPTPPAEILDFSFFERKINALKNFTKDLIKNRYEIVNKLSNFTTGLDTRLNVTLNNFKQGVKLIFPGTKWCGDGDIARNYDDLGKNEAVDRCCRDHDNCPDDIPAGKTKYNLVNQGLFTRSHCECDKKFYYCLKSVDSIVSSTIGNTYFSVLRPQCFEEVDPVTGCLEFYKERCVKYSYRKGREKHYQWFDNPLY